MKAASLSRAPSLLQDDNTADDQDDVAKRWRSSLTLEGGEDGDSNANGLTELCQYVQELEADKRELERQVHVLHEADAVQQRELTAQTRRVELLEASLANAVAASDTFRQEKDLVLALQQSERERMASLAGLLEEAHKRHDDAERARQLAVFKLSALQTTVASRNADKLLPSTTTPLSPTTSAPLTESDRVEQLKRDMELLRQRLALNEEQAADKQTRAVDAAVRDTELANATAIERVRLECESQISTWRHEEAVRGKEAQRLQDEDRDALRLELHHTLQRAEIDHRVYQLQAEAHAQRGLGLGIGLEDSDFSRGTLDEVLVRLQLELLRTRRFEALKKSLLVRRSVLTRASQRLFGRWRRRTEAATAARTYAARLMIHSVQHLAARKIRACLVEWKQASRELQARAFQAQALTCWNRMLAVERIRYVLQLVQVCGHRHAMLWFCLKLTLRILLLLLRRRSNAPRGSIGGDCKLFPVVLELCMLEIPMRQLIV